MDQNKQQAVIAQNKTDVLGIISIILAFVGFSLIGFIIGLIGVSKAKKENYSPVLSRIGWIINLVFMVIIFLIVLVVLIAIPSLQSNQRDTLTKSNVSIVSSEIINFSANNNGKLPTSLSQLNTISSSRLKNAEGENLTYTLLPIGCTTSCRDFKISTTLESGEIYERSGY